MISKEDLIKMRKGLFTQADKILVAKGAHYNFKEQNLGDTLANLRTAVKIGVVDSEMRSVLVRITDKIMRLNSFCNSNSETAVKDESVRDTVLDLINYASYYYAFYLEARGKKIE